MKARLWTPCVLLGLTLAALGAAPAPAFAQSAKASKGARKGYKPPYGMAGCGIGHSWFPNRNGPQLGLWGIRFLLSNTPIGIVFSQTWYISSGSSGCREAPNVAAGEREVFIGHNVADLSREASQGHGEALLALADLYGCEDASAKAAFVSFVQSQADVFQSTDIESQLSLRVRANKDLLQACPRV